MLLCYYADKFYLYSESMCDNILQHHLFLDLGLYMPLEFLFVCLSVFSESMVDCG